MTANERQEDILRQINQNGRVYVKQLSLFYHVSEDLIRKDLKKLTHRGLVDRIHGGAERKTNKFESSGIQSRLAEYAPEKQRIAYIAVQHIKSGDYIFLDTSSTSVYIAMAIKQSKKEITVITDMLEIMSQLSGVQGITVIGIGGVYHAYTGGFIGPESIKQIQTYRVDKAFISCRSVSLDEGVLIEGFADIGHNKKAILDIAKEKIVATMSTKYHSSGVYKFYSLHQIDGVITEMPLSPSQKMILKGFKIKEIGLK